MSDSIPHWRYTFKPARFFFLDARVSIAVLFFLLHMRIWTFVLMLIFFALFYWLERFGYDFPSAIRAVRLNICGKVRPPVKEEKLRYPIDYDRRPLF